MLAEVINIEFSARCNLECGFCFGPADDKSVPDLPLHFWLRVLEWIRTFGTKGIVVSGGEPTIYPHIHVLLERAKELGLTVVMSTNAQLRHRVLACAQYCDWIAIPVDGITQQMLVKMRGRPWGLEEAGSLIDELKLRYPGIRIKLGTVATAINLSEIPSLGRSLVQSGLRIDTWKVYQYTPRRKFQHRAAEFEVSDTAFGQLKQTISTNVQGKRFNLVFSSNEDRQRAYVFIYPDGQVVVPNVGSDMDDIVIGNLHQEGPLVLGRVEGVEAMKHLTNYNSTYSCEPPRGSDACP